MRLSIKIIVLFLMLTAVCQELTAQYYRNYSSFTPVKNNTIKRFDTLRVGQCYDLDNATAIGVIFRYWLVDMWIGVFKNNRTSEPAAVFDTVNVSDSTRLYFYRTQNPSDGVIIIWESRYIFDSELRAYLFRNGTVKKMGRLDIDLEDAFETNVYYPVSKIKMTTDGKRIIFSFMEPVKFRLRESLDPKDFYYLYDGVGLLTPVVRGKVTIPAW